MLGEHDLDAIAAGLDELERGGYAPVPWSPQLFPIIIGAWTIATDRSHLVAAGSGNTAYLSWGLMGGDHIRRIDSMVFRAGAAPVVVAVERVTLGVGVETVWIDDTLGFQTAWVLKRAELVDASVGRGAGLRVDEQTHYYRLRVTAGQAGDLFTAGEMIVGRPPTVPAP